MKVSHGEHVIYRFNFKLNHIIIIRVPPKTAFTFYYLDHFDVDIFSH